MKLGGLQKSNITFFKKFVSTILNCCIDWRPHRYIPRFIRPNYSSNEKSLVNILSKSNLINFSKIIKLWLIFIIFIQRDQYLQVESHMWKPFKKPTVRIDGNFTLSVRLPFQQGSELLSFEYFE